MIDPQAPMNSSSTTQKLLVDASRIGHICTHENGRKKVTSGMDAFHLKSIKKKYSFILEVSKSSHDLPLRFGLQGPIWTISPWKLTDVIWNWN